MRNEPNEEVSKPVIQEITRQKGRNRKAGQQRQVCCATRSLLSASTTATPEREIERMEMEVNNSVVIPCVHCLAMSASAKWTHATLK